MSGLFEAAIRFSSESALRTVKGVYSLFDFSQNWIRVRTLKLANSLITIEPRLAKKLEPKIYTLLASANAKSVDCELVRLCTAHFMTNKELVPLVKSKAEVFSESTDVNLNIIGFQAFRKILSNDPSLLKDVAELLSTKAKIEHPGLALEIFTIYQEHLALEDLPNFLKKLHELISGSENLAYKEVLGTCAIKLAIKESSRTIDWSFFVQNLLVPVSNSSKSQGDDQSFVQLINILEDKFDKNHLALQYQQILKLRRSSKASLESTFLMTRLICERASSAELDGDWLTQHVAAIMEQGEAVSTDLLGAKLLSMDADEVAEGVCSEVGYLMAHPEKRQAIIRTSIEVE